MGATYFSTAAWGKTPGDAFRAAKDHKGWEKGFGGYSGTIVEKHDFALFVLPPRLSAVKAETLASEVGQGGGVEWAREDLARASALLAAKPKGQVRQAQAAVRAAKAALRRAEREEATLTRRLGQHVDLIRRVSAVAHGDKWGPAAAVEVTSRAEREKLKPFWQTPRRGDRLFLFFGMASS